MLRLHDTATGTVTPLELREPGRVAIYVCGLTVYDVPHLGNGRPAMVFDILRRYLIFSGLDVTHVSNITDVDDQIINRSREQGLSEGELAAIYEQVWWDAVDALGILRPDEVPHATAFIERMVSFIEELVERGVAYETNDGVYLSVDAVPGYGLLAHQPLHSLLAGARVEIDEEKRSPLDFVLWKKAKAGEPTWPSPFGPGRPGWHTECVVMSLDLLGDGFEIHGGGFDLAFPHHENERAQAVAAGHSFARHWMHNGFLMTGGEKMSKSLGNFTSLSDLIEQRDPRAYRLLTLQAHYRSPVEVTQETIAQAEGALDRLDEMARRLLPATDDPRVVVPAVVDPTAGAGTGSEDIDTDAVSRFRERMDDDLDTPNAMAGIFELVREANSAADAGDDGRALRAAATVRLLCGVLGLALGGGSDEELDVETADRVRRRDEARAAADWAQADALRDELQAAGWLVEDSSSGTRVRRR
ncbi:MAG: cysteine--tRNA ligase [Acidimicrobiales bacterium]